MESFYFWTIFRVDHDILILCLFLFFFCSKYFVPPTTNKNDNDDTSSGFCPGKKKKYTVKTNNNNDDDDAYTRNVQQQQQQKKENWPLGWLDVNRTDQLIQSSFQNRIYVYLLSVECWKSNVVNNFYLKFPTKTRLLVNLWFLFTLDSTRLARTEKEKHSYHLRGLAKTVQNTSNSKHSEATTVRRKNLKRKLALPNTIIIPSIIEFDIFSLIVDTLPEREKKTHSQNQSTENTRQEYYFKV